MNLAPLVITVESRYKAGRNEYIRWPFSSLSLIPDDTSFTQCIMLLSLIFFTREAQRTHRGSTKWQWVSPLLLSWCCQASPIESHDVIDRCFANWIYSRLIFAIDIWSSLQCRWRTRFDFRFTESPNHWKGKRTWESENQPYWLMYVYYSQ